MVRIDAMKAFIAVLDEGSLAGAGRLINLAEADEIAAGEHSAPRGAPTLAAPVDTGESASANTGENLSQCTCDVCESPLLNAETELSLCHRWIYHHDISAARQLARGHLRLVIKIARGYRGYGLPFEELIGEGNIGLMRAVCRFDPNRGARFATYAVWWVRAAIQQYILYNWSLVKMGTTTSQKKLFFNLRRIRGRLQAFDDDVPDRNIRIWKAQIVSSDDENEWMQSD